jgi:hypothetical protein
MKRLVAGLVLGGALVAPSALRAQTLFSGSTYEFCGGGAYMFCGMVNLTVTNPSVGLYHVALVVVNRSGDYGSRAGAEFVSTGLENVLPTLGSGLTLSNFQMYTGSWNGSTFASLGSACAAATPTKPDGCWDVQATKSEGGGINVDFDASTSTGNKPALSASCNASDPAPAATDAEIYTCARGSNLSQWRPVQISFDANQDIRSADLYVKSIDATLSSTDCLSTQSKYSASLCTPVTSTPEPASLALLGSGMLGLLGIARTRNG